MDSYTLNDGTVIPCIGLGTFRAEPAVCERAVASALEAGYRVIDTANIYYNEKAVGRGIRSSSVPRGEIFLTSKLWPSDFSPKRARAAIDKTLSRLGTDYVDLLLLHRPYGDVDGAWEAIGEAIGAGKVRCAGVSNFTEKHLKKLLSRHGRKPAVDQIECHPYFQRRELRAFLKENDILPKSWFPLGSGSKKLQSEETIVALAKKYGKSPAQIVLRWHVQEGALVIPGSKDPAHIRENLALFDFALTEEEMDAIRALDTNKTAFRSNPLVQRIQCMTRMNFDKQK